MGVVDEWTAWAGGGAGPGIFKSIQRIEIAAGAFGSVSGTTWLVNNPVTIPVPVVAANTVALCFPRTTGPQARRDLMRCYCQNSTTVRLLGGQYGQWLGADSPQNPLVVWVYEYEPDAIKSLYKHFWQNNSITTLAMSPAVDLDRMFFYDQAGAYGNTSNNNQEWTWGFWTLTDVEFRPSKEGFTNAAIPHHVTHVVEYPE